MLRNFIVKLDFVPKRFAGHSKWANIRHTKEAKDTERSLIFNRLSRQIKVAITEGGSSDPKNNLKLSQVVDQCRRFNMPTATLQSVIKSCEQDKSNSKLYVVDIKGPGSCMIICELYTSNLHRTKQIMVTTLKKCNSKFTEGSGLHMFEEKGIIEAENNILSAKSPDEQLELATEHAIESNAEDVSAPEKNIFQFTCGKQNFPNTQNLLEKLGYKITNASVDFVPVKWQAISQSDFELFEKLMTKLEEMPEVVRLFDNVTSDRL